MLCVCVFCCSLYAVRVCCKVDVVRKRTRLTSVVNKLLSNVPGRQRVDLSYLLHSRTGKRQTRKPAYLQQFMDTSRQSRDSDTAAPPTTT